MNDVELGQQVCNRRCWSFPAGKDRYLRCSYFGRDAYRSRQSRALNRQRVVLPCPLAFRYRNYGSKERPVEIYLGSGVSASRAENRISSQLNEVQRRPGWSRVAVTAAYFMMFSLFLLRGVIAACFLDYDPEPLITQMSQVDMKDGNAPTANFLVSCLSCSRYARSWKCKWNTPSSWGCLASDTSAKITCFIIIVLNLLASFRWMRVVTCMISMHLILEKEMIHCMCRVKSWTHQGVLTLKLGPKCHCHKGH